MMSDKGHLSGQNLPSGEKTSDLLRTTLIRNLFGGAEEARQSAWRLYFEFQYPRMLATARRGLGPWGTTTDAEEIVQESILYVLKYISNKDKHEMLELHGTDAKKFLGEWIRKIIQYRTIDYIRNRHSKKERQIDLEIDEHAAETDQLETRLRLSTIREYLPQLEKDPLQLRLVFDMLTQGYKKLEIADKLEISSASVTSRVEKIKEIVEELIIKDIFP